MNRDKSEIATGIIQSTESLSLSLVLVVARILPLTITTTITITRPVLLLLLLVLCGRSGVVLVVRIASVPADKGATGTSERRL